MRDLLNRKAWAWSHCLEQRREVTHAAGHLWTQAAACIGLAILRSWGC